MATEVGAIKARLTLETREFSAGMDRAKKNLTEVAAGAKKSAEEIRKMAETREQISKLAAQLDNVNAKAEIQRRKLADLQRQLRETFDDKKKLAITDEIVKAESAMLALEKQSDATAKKIGELEDSLEGAGAKAGIFGKEAKAGVTALGVAYAALGAAMVGVIKKSVDLAASFEQSMARTKAVTGATASEFEALKNQAMELGATTVFTASEAAEAQGYLAVAGFKTNEIIGAMPGVLNLAAAAQMDLARTADIASNILTGFGLKAEETGRVADVLAKTFTSSNTSMEQLGYGFKYVAPVAAAAGISIEDTAAAIGRLSDAGIQGEMAGTQLRAIILRLIKPVGEAEDVMDQLGIKTQDAAGNILPFTEIIRQLETAFGGLTQSAQTEAAALIAGQEAVAGLLTLVNNGADNLNAFAAELRDAGGAAEDIADTQMDTFNGAVLELKSALEAAGITIGNDFIPALRSAAEWLTKGILGFNDMDASTRQGIIAMAGATFGAGVLSTAIFGVVVAMRALQAANIATYATLAPFIAVPALIGGIAYAITEYTSSANEAKAAQEAFNGVLDTAPFERTAEDVELLKTKMDELNGLLQRQLELQDEVGAKKGYFSDLWGDAMRSIGAAKTEMTATQVELWKVEKQMRDTYGVKTPEEAAERIAELNAEIERSIPALIDAEQATLADTAAKLREVQAAEQMIDRYSELSRQTNLTAEQKSELSDIVRRLADLYPDLNAQLDENGNMVITNESAVRTLIAAENDSIQAVVTAAKERTKARRIETEKAIEYAQKQIQALESVANAGGRSWTSFDKPNNPAFNLSPAIMDMVDKDIEKYKAQQQASQQELNRLDLLAASLEDGSWAEVATGGGGGLPTGTGTLDGDDAKKKKDPKAKAGPKPKTAEQLAQEAYRASLQFIEKKRLLNEMSEAEELKRLAELADRYKKYDDIWIDAQNRKNRLSDQMATAEKKRQEDAKKSAEAAARSSYEASAEWIEMETRRMTEAGVSEREIAEMQLEAWTRVRSRYDRDSEHYKRADKAMFDLRMGLRKMDEKAAKDAADAAEKAQKAATKSALDAIDKLRKAELDALDERKRATQKFYDDQLAMLDESERKLSRTEIEAEAAKYRNATSEAGRKRYAELVEQLRKMDVEDQKRALQTERDEKLAALDAQKRDIDDWYADIKEAAEAFNGDMTTLYQLTEDARFQAFVDTNTKILAEMERFKAEMGAAQGSGNAVVNQMRANSERWKAAGPDERKRLEAENQRLGRELGAQYDAGSGKWLRDGIPLYHSGGIAGDKPFRSGDMLLPGEFRAILRQGEVTLTPAQIDALVSGRGTQGTVVNVEKVVGLEMPGAILEDEIDLRAAGRVGSDNAADIVRRKFSEGGR